MNNMNYEQLINSFVNTNILIIGDVMVDSYLYGKVERISPEAPVPVVNVSKREYRLGGAANVALNIAKLGGTPYLCSVVGQDAKADILLKLLDNENLSDEGIVKDNNRLTTTKFRIIGNNTQMLRVDEEIIDTINTDVFDNLCGKIKSIIQSKKINGIIFQDYDKGVVSLELIQFVTNIAKQQDIPIAVDPKKKNFFNYRNVELFKPNLKEFSEGVKKSFQMEQFEYFSDEVEKFQIEQNIAKCMITLSEHGIFLSDNKNGINSKIHEKAYKRNIADVSGAGDTVISVASMCLALGASDEQIVKLSNLAGGIVCQYVGVEPISKEELIREAKRLLA